MSTCRFCKDYSGEMFRYGPRHNAHAKCGLDRFSADFIDKLHPHQVGQLPFMLLKERGLLEKAVAVTKLHQLKVDAWKVKAKEVHGIEGAQ
jgi:hypothetical protein